LHSGIKTSSYQTTFGTSQRIGLADSRFTEDTYSSIETEEELEHLFNAGMKNGRDKEEMEEANLQPRKDEDENQTNETSEEATEKTTKKSLLCDL
jgi:LPS O-antigen subunit length determinant protein (WzzB/FepE family)